MASFNELTKEKASKTDDLEVLTAEKLDPEEMLFMEDKDLPEALVVEAATGQHVYKITGPKGKSMDQTENYDRASHVTIELSRIVKNGVGVIQETSKAVTVPLPFRTDKISLVTQEGFAPKDVVKYVLNMIDGGAPLIIHHVNPALLASERTATRARNKKALSAHKPSVRAQRLMTA